MSSSFGPGLTAPFSSDTPPWVWALIPVGFVVVIGAVALCLHSRRRRKHFEAGLSSTSTTGGTRLDPAGTRALERDLEEAWVRGATPTRRPPARHHRSGSGAPSAAAGRWTRPASRWQWAGLSRQEEGLNELGEAPPPYEKQGNAESARKSSSVDGNLARNNVNDDESVELQNLSPPTPPPPPPVLTITRATSTTISMYGDDEMGENARLREPPPPPMPMAQHHAPPAYEGDEAPTWTMGTATSLVNGEDREDQPPPPPPLIGGYDDGTAVVSVTPVPAAVLPPPERR